MNIKELKIKCFYKPLLILILLFMAVFSGMAVARADSDSIDGVGMPDKIDQNYAIYDQEGFLSESDYNRVMGALKEVYDDYQVSAFVTISTKIGMSDDYEGYLERKWTSLPSRNSVVLLIGFKENDHVYIIRSYGEENAESKLSTARLQSIQDDMEDSMRNHDFGEASYIYAKDVYKYLGSYDSVYEENIFLIWWVQLIIILFVFTAIFMISAYSAGGTNTVTPTTYLDSKKSRVVQGHERYLRTTVSKVKVSSDSSGGGGGGGGGGHSSGGRSF